MLFGFSSKTQPRIARSIRKLHTRKVLPALIAAFLLLCFSTLGSKANPSVEELVAEGGVKVLRDNGLSGAFDDQIRRMSPNIRKGESVPAAAGTRLHEEYTESYREYLVSQDAEPQRRDFLGRRANNNKVYRLGNLEIWLEHGNAASGDRHNLDLTVWELEIDGNEVKRARGVGTDLFTRHPLDKLADVDHRDHFRRKAFAAEATIGVAEKLGIEASIDVNPDRSFYYVDSVLERDATPEHRFNPSDLADDKYWTNGKGGKSRSGIYAARAIVGALDDGNDPRALSTSADAYSPGSAPETEGKKTIRNWLLGIGTGVISFTTQEAQAAIEVVSDRRTQLSQAYYHILDDNWDELAVLLQQGDVEAQMAGELAALGSKASVFSSEIIRMLWEKYNAAKAVETLFFLEGEGGKVRLGDGKWANTSADAAQLKNQNILDQWGGRMPIPQGVSMRAPRLVFERILGADHDVDVFVNEVSFAKIGNGQDIEIALPKNLDGRTIRIFVIPFRNNGGIDDLEIVSPAIKYYAFPE